MQPTPSTRARVSGGLTPQRLAAYAVIYRSDSYHDVTYDMIPATELPFSYRPLRGGVIVQYGDYYGLGLDCEYKELSDFGGGVSYRRDGSLSNGAARELYEESLGVFDVTGDDIAAGSRVVGQKNMAIFIWQYTGTATRDELTAQFQQQLATEEKPEMCDLIWLDQSSMKHAMEGAPYRGYK